jgi:hypothetical protein
MLWQGASVFPVSFEGPLYLVVSNDTQGYVKDIFTGPHSVTSYDTQGSVEDLF